MSFFDDLTEDDADEYLDPAECEGLISFSDFMELLELFTKETSKKVAEYLIGCADFLRLDFYIYEIAGLTQSTSATEFVFSPCKYDSYKDDENTSYPTENFLEDTLLENGVKDYWVYYWKIEDLLSLKCIAKLELDDENFINYRDAMVGGAYTAIYYQDAAKILIDKVKQMQEIIDSGTSTVPAKEGVDSTRSNGSLASYMTEYTLPQVVALILHIDLADITTNSSNSYIHEQDRYDESTHHKFNNLLQSYSIAALNNKIDGADVFTRTIQNFLGAPDTQTDLEKTTISRGNLASYLDSIGYQLDDLIAKQERVHTIRSQQDDSGLVSSLQQKIAELQSHVDEKTEELKNKSAKLDLAQGKIEELGRLASNDKQLSDNTANDYQVTIGMLLELLRTPKGFDKEGKPNEPIFRTQTAIVEAVMSQLMPNHAKTKVSERFTASMAALNKAKRGRDDELEHKATLAAKIKGKTSLFD